MRFWIREVAGWLLVALGLYIFYICFLALFTAQPLIIEASIFVFVGFVVFRGGIHLLKVAMAARVCTEQRLSPQVAPKKTGKPLASVSME